ncbi:MAG: FadR family transcriptional regulator, partial [Anaerolineae bacterium]|nr:FadR family transcriptional regulator [Anaerolineae bacterium]
MIARRLMTLLKEKQLKPGDKLPPERELAAMMQVSRPSLREGLRALSMMNVLEIRQGDGTYVTSLDPELLVEQLSLVLALDDSTLLQLFEARKILEVG